MAAVACVSTRFAVEDQIREQSGTTDICNFCCGHTYTHTVACIFTRLAVWHHIREYSGTTDTHTHTYTVICKSIRFAVEDQIREQSGTTTDITFAADTHTHTHIQCCCHRPFRISTYGVGFSAETGNKDVCYLWSQGQSDSSRKS